MTTSPLTAWAEAARFFLRLTADVLDCEAAEHQLRSCRGDDDSAKEGRSAHVAAAMAECLRRHAAALDELHPDTPLAMSNPPPIVPESQSVESQS